jgi:hypothetical protein
MTECKLARRALDQSLNVVESLIRQYCTERGGEYDSLAISAIAEGMYLLHEHDRFEIESGIGRRVIGRFVGHNPTDDSEPTTDD